MKTTPIAMSVHPEGHSPIYSEKATHVCIEDEGAGPFLSIKQCNDEIKPGEIRCDMDELEAIVRAARKLITAQPVAQGKEAE